MVSTEALNASSMTSSSVAKVRETKNGTRHYSLHTEPDGTLKAIEPQNRKSGAGAQEAVSDLEGRAGLSENLN